MFSITYQMDVEFAVA